MIWALISGFGIGWIVGMSPGPACVLVTRAVALRGRHSGYLCALGIATALLAHVAVGLFLLEVASGSAPAILAILQGLAGLYLVYLGIQSLRAIRMNSASTSLASSASNRPFLAQGFVSTLLNPNALLFFGSIAGPFVAGAGSSFEPLAMIGGVVAGVLCWFVTLSTLLGRLLAASTARREAWVHGVAGVIFVALGAVSITVAATTYL